MHGCHKTAAETVEINHTFYIKNKYDRPNSLSFNDFRTYWSVRFNSSFGDDDDDSNDDGERYIYNLEYVKVGR